MKTKNLKSAWLLAALLVAAPGIPAAHASASLDLAKQLNQAFIEVADEVSPCVVVINVTEKSDPNADDNNDNNPLDMLPREFRPYFHHQMTPQPQEKIQGQGSGIIIRKNGYILTNRHVVDNASKIEVRLKDGRRFPATVRGTDPQSDVAVIKIDADDLPVAKLADSSKTRVGEFAIAIGAPFSLDYSVTFGHVSAKGRSSVIYDPSMDQDFIQTDANINPGNSGGPLVNIDGEVIGINTLIQGLHTGIGFAIPINLAKEVADKLITDGKFTRAWLGIGIRGLREDPDFQGLIKGVNDGVVVQSIMPDSPAAKSSLKPTDVITAVDGHPVSTAQQLKDEIRTKKIGRPVTLAVVRNGKNVDIDITPGVWDDNATDDAVRPASATSDEASSLGLTVQALTHGLADQFGVDMTPGVIVTGVDQGSLADEQGIKPGDIITEINQQPVTNPREFRAALKNVDLKRGVIINLVSGKTSRFAILKNDD
ncbi:MAG TPA: trypsin-like peptidase domain-containing protein [Dongiaceae bacterium]|jgi:serine protease Do|nr:trypsin-like peptidase domain-containing protein [Dongiaceae bacterium]